MTAVVQSPPGSTPAGCIAWATRAIEVEATKVHERPLLNGCVVADAFVVVAARTGFGATITELDAELRSQGHDLEPATITYALRDVDGALLVRSAKNEDYEPIVRDGRQVFLLGAAS